MASGRWPVLPWAAQVCADRTELCTQLRAAGGVADTAVGRAGFIDEVERRSVDTRPATEAADESTQAAGGWQYGCFSLWLAAVFAVDFADVHL